LRNVLAMADGNLSDAEKQFILRLRKKLGVGGDEFRSIVEEFKANPKRLSLPRGPAAQEALDVLRSMAEADGQVSEPEERLLERVAEWAGLKTSRAKAPLSSSSAEAPPAEPGQHLEVDDEQSETVNRLGEEAYRHFGEWDESARKEKVTALAGFGPASLLGLLRIMESYRVPDGMKTALPLKTQVARQLGELGDSRATYYLGQQVSLGDTDDEISNEALRCASAEALGKIVAQDFSADQAGVEAARRWWRSYGNRAYTSLAI